MFYPLLSTLLQYGIGIAGGIGLGMTFKAVAGRRAQEQVRDLQEEVITSHAKILELEATNDKLQKELKAARGSFIKDQLFMN